MYSYLVFIYLLYSESYKLGIPTSLLLFFFLLQVLKKMREIIGFSEGDSILAPGGSISNMYGLLCARHRFFPDYKTKGTSAMDQSQIAIYTSAQVRKNIVYFKYLSLFS